MTTLDTSGPNAPVPFAHFDPECALWSRAQTSLLSSEGTSFAKSSVTWPKQGSMRSGRSYRHRTWVRPTSVNVSSLLPTPTASNPNDGEDLESWEARRQVNLTKGYNGNGQGTPLGIAVKLLPTVTVMDAASSRNSTAKRSDPNSAHHSGDTLLDALTLLPTPRTTDGQGGGHHGDGGPDLRTTVGALADADSPRSKTARSDLHEFIPGERNRTDWGKYTPAVERWARIFRPAPTPLDEKGRLNVSLPEWMMGAPENWCDGLSRTAAIKGYGNGVVVQVAEAVGRWALEGP